MATKILFAPRQSQEVLDIVRSLTPHGFELVVADFGTPEFYDNIQRVAAGNRPRWVIPELT